MCSTSDVVQCTFLPYESDRNSLPQACRLSNTQSIHKLGALKT